MLKIATKSWWESDQYTDEAGIPTQITEHCDLFGPRGMALVKVFSDGSTQPGWGLTGREGSEGFMQRYADGEFLPTRALYHYDTKGDPFAFVMRSLRAVVVDIDGKNGGLDGVKQLGALPRTLAETSKSGNGYHLWYYLPEEWDEAAGYGMLPDAIGIAPGVDIRAVGCVYHYSTQRWNGLPMATLPDWLRDRLLEKKQKQAAAKANVQKITTLDETEQLMAHALLVEELNKPIKPGARNTTLFAIGGKMKLAGMESWETEIERRGEEIGLDSGEIGKIITNIENYA